MLFHPDLEHLMLPAALKIPESGQLFLQFQKLMKTRLEIALDE